MISLSGYWVHGLENQNSLLNIKGSSFMKILLGCTQFILIAIICVQDAKKKSPAVFLWATLLVMFGVMHLLTVFSGDDQYSDSTLNEASLFVIFFCILYMLTRSVIGMFSNRCYPLLSCITNENNAIPNYNFVSYLVILFAVVSFMMCYKLISFSGSILNTSWGEGREYSASLNYVNSNQILNILYFSLGGLPLLLWLKNDRKASVLCVFCIMAVVILTRNRIQVLPLLVSIFGLRLLKITRLRITHFIWGIIACVLVIYVIYGLRVFRHYGDIERFIQEFKFAVFLSRINDYIATDNGELGLRNAFYYFIQEKNDFPGFCQLASYSRMLLVYVPTQFSFGLKPDDFAIAMGAAVGMGAGGSMHPTLFGDCYANAGFAGVFLGVFWAFYCSTVDKIVVMGRDHVIQVLSYCLSAVVFAIMGRGAVYNSFFLIAWGMPILWIIVTVLKKITKEQT